MNFVSRVLLLFPIALFSGCSTTPGKFGGNVTFVPGWERLKQSAVAAARDPGTWVPAVGTALVLASGNDGTWTQEALRENPVYGSKVEAARVSDEHAAFLDRLWLTTALLADSGDVGSKEWWSNKTAGLFGQIVIVDTSILTTNVLKKLIWRREPDPELRHVEHEGFPSNHSTPPFTQVALIRRNLEWVEMPDYGKYAVITVAHALAASSAYGRVEAGLHHFSDQLAGAALGNWLGLTLHDAFMPGNASRLTVLPTEGGAMLTLSMPFL